LRSGVFSQPFTWPLRPLERRGRNEARWLLHQPCVKNRFAHVFFRPEAGSTMRQRLLVLIVASCALANGGSVGERVLLGNLTSAAPTSSLRPTSRAPSVRPTSHAPSVQPTPPTAPTTTAPTSSPAASSGSSLSSGAIAGIVIACVVAALLILLCILISCGCCLCKCAVDLTKCAVGLVKCLCDCLLCRCCWKDKASASNGAPVQQPAPPPTAPMGGPVLQPDQSLAHT